MIDCLGFIEIIIIMFSFFTYLEKLKVLQFQPRATVL